ncbi:MAG: SUMF1/EgtB/PvdO family nonheme iron enzyme [Myxococcaceae bacterium]|nr:SUMF1/EgtB/PvdO family nonheme iron enzyme [Myxococcaceae bacterium]
MPADASAFKDGDIIDERYRIQGLIGTGPVGQVYKAFDQELDVAVAIKAISPKLLQSPEERKSFAAEIRLARKFSQPNLVHVHGDGTANKWPFFTMQLLEGLTLRRIIDLRREKNERFTLGEIEPIFAQIAAALDAAHAVGPHGGVKPENVIVLPDLLKLTDFGLGLALPRLPFVAAQRAKGAHAYLAPEFVSGQEDVDRRIDIYALGVILGEMLAGVRPEGGQVPELRQHAPHLPAEIESLYRRALNDNPLSRHSTAAEFLAELSSIIAEFPDETPPKPLDEAFQPDAEPTPDAGAIPPPIPAADQPPPIPTESARVKSASKKARKQSATSTLLVVLLGIAISAPIAWFALSQKGQPAPTADATEVTQPVAKASTSEGKSSADAPQAPTADTKADSAREATKSDTPKSSDKAVAQAASPAADHAQEAATATSAQQKRPEPSTSAKVDAPPQEASAQSAQPKPAVKEDAKPMAKTDVKKAAQPAAHKPQSKGKESAPKAQSAKRASRGGCPSQMKLIHAGSFKAGTTADDPMRGFGERGLESVSMPAYCIDIYEYPNRKGVRPKGGVTYAAAEAACAKEGKRLCTENEWERACKGARNDRFPYGNTFDDELCNTQTPSGRPREVKGAGEARRCLSSFGVADLAGNLAEWTASSYNARGTGKAIKGGAANRPDHASRCSARRNGPVNKSDEFVGFRCCADTK